MGLFGNDGSGLGFDNLFTGVFRDLFGDPMTQKSNGENSVPGFSEKLAQKLAQIMRERMSGENCDCPKCTEEKIKAQQKNPKAN